MPAAPTSPPTTAPVQPAPSATPPAAKPPVSSPKTAPAPSAQKPSKPVAAPPKAPEPAKPAEAKPLSLMEEAFAGIKKIPTIDAEDLLGEKETETPPSPPENKEQPKPDEAPEQKAEEGEADEAQEEDKAVQDLKALGKKPSPWALMEYYKKKAQAAEHEIVELRTKGTEPPKEYADRYSALEKRNQELEEHMRFLDYSKSQEFVEKYNKPYEEAWMRAVTGLKGLKINSTNQQTGEVASRDVTPQDIMVLANMDPAAARTEIKTLFPEDAAEVRGYIDRIRDLYAAQHQALEEHKTKGGEWLKQQTEKAKAAQEANAKLWKQYSDEAREKFEFLKPLEGDDERNMKLEKAATFVAEALAARANDPKLSEEERANVIKKHVAVRNRAIAYSVLMHENKKLKAQLQEKETALKAFEESAPTDGNGKGKQVVTMKGDTIDSAVARLATLGRPF